MHIINTGKSRIVIAFPTLGFVLKVARINWGGIKKIPSIILKRIFKSVPADVKATSWVDWLNNALEFYSLGGLYSNLREFFLWIWTRNKFLCPTYFSFFGIVNIMRYEKRILTIEEYDRGSFATQFNFYSKFWSQGTHTFSNPENFSITRHGRIRMIDYGFKYSWYVIKHSGQDLYNGMDLNPTVDEIELLRNKIKKNWKDWVSEILRIDPW